MKRQDHYIASIRRTCPDLEIESIHCAASRHEGFEGIEAGAV
jgi:hypothetical protein